MKTNIEVREVLNDLFDWNENVGGIGGFDAPAWDRARAFRDSLFEEPVPTLVEVIAEGLDASVDGRGFDGKHLAAVNLANAAPKLLSNLKDMQHAFGKLHDGLSDMIEGGRLQEGDIPDDYRWLAESLVNTISIDDAVKAVIKQVEGE